MNEFEKTFSKNYNMLNEEQREAVDQIDGPVLVIAGPGTGKTQLLSTRIANILAKTDTSPENILAMTFTEAGARNMRERLTTLIGMEAYKIGIFTYHGFSNEIIQNYSEFFLEKDLDNLADELTQKTIVQNLKNNLPHNSLLRKIQSGYFISLISEMKKSLVSPSKLAEIAQINLAEQDIFHQKIKGLRAPNGRKLDILIPFYTEIKEALESSITKNFETDKIFSNLSFYLDKLNKSIDKAIEENKTKPLTDWKNEFLKNKDSEDNFQIKDVIVNKRLLEFADFYQKYIDEMQKEMLYDFDDMILEVVNTISNNDELRLTLQEKYQYILLDEYQDTNESQARIVQLLTDNPIFEGKPNVLAVGDDDQAIMAFQGASKSNMRDFYNYFKENTKIVNLTKNYRSHHDILDSAKNVAETIGGRLTNSLPVKINKDIIAKGNFEGREIKIKRTKFKSQISEFSWVAEEISRLIKNGVPAKNIAVMAPVHKILQEISPYFKNQEVPIWYEKRENILENEIILQLVNISRLVLAIRDKNDTEMANLFPEVLSYPFWQIPAIESWKMSWSAKDNNKYWIQAMLDSSCEEINKLGHLLISLSELSYTKSFEEMIDFILGSKEIPEDISPNSLKSPMREYLNKQPEEDLFDTISNLTVLRDHLRQYQKNNKNTLEAIIDFTEAYSRAEALVMNTNPHHSTDNAVKILTPFAAKGLEFEYVFLLSANNTIWNKKSGGNRGIEMPTNLKFVNIEDEGEDTRKRLFFVALTRAKTHLYITNYESEFNGNKATVLKFLDERMEDDKLKSKILPEEWQIVEENDIEPLKLSNLQTNWHEYYTVKNESMKDLLRTRVENLKISPTNVNSFIDLQYGGPQSFFENNILRFPESYGADATLGTLVHEGFQRIQNEINNGNTPKFENLYAILQEKIKKYPFPENDASRIVSRFERIFKQVFSSELINDFKPGNRAEVNFSSAGVTIGDAVLTGKIDLIEIDKANKTINVIDYKTGGIPLVQNKQVVDKNCLKIHKYTQQLYFYKILIENTQEFAGYQVKKGILKFIEPSPTTNKHHILEIEFNPVVEENLKELIQAIWHRIKSFNFEIDEKYDKDFKSIKMFEEDLIHEFEERKNG